MDILFSTSLKGGSGSMTNHYPESKRRKIKHYAKMIGDPIDVIFSKK